MVRREEILAKARHHLDSPRVYQNLKDFICNYLEGICHTEDQREEALTLLYKYTDFVIEQSRKPHSFELFHQGIRAPFDFYRFGIDFVKGVIDDEISRVFGLNHLDLMRAQLAKGENVILLANHQTEPDPQVICYLLEPTHGDIASLMIFVAGHRVTTDPLAIPFSMGCNLLCIYSKKHINYPPKDKPRKVQENQKTLKKMEELLSEGGQCIYVAPSGGRDRKNSKGEVEVAPFNAESIELFRIIAKQSGKPVHFYPLALNTYTLFPPPKEVEKELGERREVSCGPAKIAFGPEIDMELNLELPKKEQRQKRADAAWSWVAEAYRKMAD